jgi:hypothetical protein
VVLDLGGRGSKTSKTLSDFTGYLEGHILSNYGITEPVCHWFMRNGLLITIRPQEITVVEEVLKLLETSVKISKRGRGS